MAGTEVAKRKRPRYDATTTSPSSSDNGLLPSMIRKGDCWDNAVVESFFATLKTELTDTFADLRHAKAALAEYVDFDFYNYERLHSTLGYTSPAFAELKQPQPAVHAA